MDRVFSVQVMVRSYHHYKAILEAAIDAEVLSCEREVGNVLESSLVIAHRRFLHVCATKIINLIFGRKAFIRKFWTRKFWRFPTTSPNSPKFFPTNIFRYTVLVSHYDLKQILALNISSSYIYQRVRHSGWYDLGMSTFCIIFI